MFTITAWCTLPYADPAGGVGELTRRAPPTYVKHAWGCQGGKNIFRQGYNGYNGFPLARIAPLTLLPACCLHSAEDGLLVWPPGPLECKRDDAGDGPRGCAETRA